MMQSGITPLRSFAWAILVGVSAFIALFYVSFSSMSEREDELIRFSARADSLRFATVHLLWHFEAHPSTSAALLPEIRALLSSADSLFGAFGIDSPDSVIRAAQELRAYVEEIASDPRLADHDRTLALIGEVQTRRKEHVQELLGRGNADFRFSINLWAGFSGLIMVLGFFFTLWLASSQAKKTTDHERLATILRVTDDPIVTYAADGRTIFMNQAFRTRFDKGTDGTSTRIDRLAYLNTSPEDSTSERLWSEMISGLDIGTSWTTEVPVMSSGRSLQFSLFAIRGQKQDTSSQEIVIFHTDMSEHQELRARARDVEDQYRSIVENSPDALVLIQEGQVIYTNRSALLLFGFRASDEISLGRFSDLFGPAGKPAFHVSLSESSVGEKIFQNAEFRATTREGKLIDVEVSASVVRWGENLALQATFRDITERKVLEREQALWAWEQDALSEIDRRLVGIADLQTVLDSIIRQILNLSRAQWAGILMYDDSGNFVQWRTTGGISKRQVQGESFKVTPTIRAVLNGTEPLVVQELKESDRQSLGAELRLVDEGIISSVWLPLRVEGTDEGVLAVGFHSHHAFSSREMRLLTSLAEKTAIALDNARLYENLVEREKELEILSGARIDAQEEERRRIAREIHDGLGQLLTAVKLNVEILEDAPSLRPEDLTKIGDIKQLLDNVMQEARQISYDLMPSVLEDFGLSPAIHLLSERFGEHSRVKVQYFGKGDIGRLDRRVEIALYRIVQEALTNSVRHGDASQITIQLAQAGGILRLTIEDNGKGMEKSMHRTRRAQGGGIGLSSMKERVNSFNGVLEIDSAPDEGTLVIVEIPVEKIKKDSKS